VCAGGQCLATCATASDCGGGKAECVERTGRYGNTDGKRICHSPSDQCVQYVCGLSEESVEAFVACVDTNPTTCNEAYACIPPELQ
jgi:hypothetical protein